MATDTVTSQAVERFGGFLGDSTIYVGQPDDSCWGTLQPRVYQGKTQQFVVPQGHRADFASVPRPLVWFIPRYGPHVAPGAAVILLLLPIFALAELLAWLPLLANQWIRAGRGQPAKPVKPPSLRLKT